MLENLPPLSTGEKLLNQRFLAEKCMTEERAVQLWKEYQKQGKMNSGHRAASTSLSDSLTKCNAALEMASLEVVGIVFPQPTINDDNDNDGENGGAGSSSQPRRAKTTTKYLALIHKHTPNTSSTAGGEPQQQSASRIAFVKSCLGGPMAMKHRRAILEHLTHHTTAKRSNLINLRNELHNSHNRNNNSPSQSQSQNNNNDTAERSSLPNYTLAMAEHTVDEMVQDQWLIPVEKNNNGGASQRRSSAMAAHLALGPRTFMELTDMLTEQFGLEESKLPQQLFYR